MNIYIYSDESGVFDKIHNDKFVFGGLICLSKEEKEIESRKYIRAEKCLREKDKYKYVSELKASILNNRDKAKLFRSLNNCIKFGVVIEQQRIYDSIFAHKKTKQRYLDYAYKRAVKNCLRELVYDKIIDPNERHNLNFYVDDHTTATDGYYELRESLEEELKFGMHNFDYGTYHPPLFPNMNNLTLNYCDSKKVTLIRAADIIANKIYYMAINDCVENNGNLHISYLP